MSHTDVSYGVSVEIENQEEEGKTCNLQAIPLLYENAADESYPQSKARNVTLPNLKKRSQCKKPEA